MGDSKLQKVEGERLAPTKNQLQEGAAGSSSSLTHPNHLFAPLIPYHSTLGLRLAAVIDIKNPSNSLKLFFLTRVDFEVSKEKKNSGLMDLIFCDAVLETEAFILNCKSLQIEFV